MPHWRVVGQDGKTALQDLSGRLGRLDTSDRDALEGSVANERLRSCITGARLTIAEVAAQVGVDPKTVERWIVLGRIPHRSHRWATASLLGTDEAYLWPELADEQRTQAASTSELVTLYPNRGAIPGSLWRSLLEAASDRIDVLVYAGLFLPDGYPEIAKLLAAKAEQGTTVRLTLGDPNSDAVRRRERRNRSAMALPPGSGWACCTYGRRSTLRGSSCASTPPRSTTRSTGSMTTCWSTPTSTAPSRPLTGAAPAAPARWSAVRPLPGIL